MSSRRHLAAVAALLFLAFFLRARNPGTLPGFVDELSHIERGEIIYAMERNPTAISHGKLLYYFWLGLFETPHRYQALEIARMATALFTLLGGAAVAAGARALFGRRAVIPALVFYAVVPYSVFFERMALADPFATALAALTAWHSVTLARRPSWRRGVITGLAANGAMFAKLTVAPVLALPVLAAILFGGVPFPRRPTIGNLWRWLRALVGRYWRAWLPTLLFFAAGWGMHGIWALQAVHNDERPIILDTYLTETTAEADALADKLSGFADRAELLLTAPLALGAVALVALALWRRPRPAIYALAWLLLLWGPSTLLASGLQTRYLIAALPALAVLLGGGFGALGVLLARLLRRPESARALGSGAAALVLGVWSGAFALPFDWRAGSDPAALEMPARDTYDYFYGPFNTWGIRAALDWLDAHGERIDGEVPVIGVLQLCSLATLYLEPPLDWECWGYYQMGSAVTFDPSRWPFVPDRLDSSPFVYVVNEFPEAIAPGEPPDLAGQQWEQVYTYTKPHGERPFTLWRVTPAE